jgi:hypothetical protein
MMLGASPLAVFGMLQTRKSPSTVCAASMSDFCFDDEPCQASMFRGDGGLFVLNVWRMVKDGCKLAIRMEPFMYLSTVSIPFQRHSNLGVSIPDRKGAAVRRRCKCGNGVEYCPCRYVFRG